jgi:hypothetical protein
MSGSDDTKLSMGRVKRLFRDFSGDSHVSMSVSASNLLTDVCTEFVHLVALAGLDRSEKSKKYVDSNGVLKALQDLGFGDIVDELPDLSGYTEDFLAMDETLRSASVNPTPC